MVLVYRETDITNISDILKDIRSDIAMARSNIPAQATDAIDFHDKVKRENPNMEVTVTGHSLGGSLAEIVSSIRGTTAITFNAYGVRDMFKSGTKLKEDNVINYINEQDGITMVNGENHIGEIYATPNLGNSKSACHSLEGMGNLSRRQQKTPEEIKNTTERIHAIPLFAKRQINKIGNSSSQCAGSYTVSGYTRSDGTEVGGYTRTCGAKHSN
ncbi:MAG: lipase family protein [Candidatus Gastranaerophilales bacterium]|nr:lipase family protein [Candidatus Gastranaerophilales bacterium]MCM1072195.1 lipase family protein [Bacteroides sp.]